MLDNSEKKACVTWLLIAVNLVYFLYLEIIGSTEDAYFMYEKGAIVASAVLQEREYYRLFAAMFMHFGIRHLVNNMIVLFALGEQQERALGHVRYLIFYMLCGVGSNLVSALLEDPAAPVVSAGASGAIFGVAGGLLYEVAVNRGQLGNLGIRQIVIMIALSLYMGITGQGVDNTAHISGVLIGIAAAAILYRRPRAAGGDDTDRMNDETFR